jgi:tRNA dimethylallyltransferase
MEKPRLIVILGQTSTGKSDFAVSLAKRVNGEIISADSRQVYKGLNLLSGKITKKEMGGVPHHLLDVVSAKKVFSVAEFQKKAAKAIDQILKKKKIPILVGGTGFYIDAVVSGQVLPEVPPNLALRKKSQNMTLSNLVKKLYKLDPERAKTIDQNNKVRLIRAIEIAAALGKVPEIKQKDSPYEIIKIGLTLPDEVLKKKIHARLLKRIQQGMLKEAKKLHDSGVSWKRMNELGLEARFAAHYLQGKLSKADMLSQLETAIWHYAKRQKTWFKRDSTIRWVDPRKKINLNSFL